jgi:hypothetical protein
MLANPINTTLYGCKNCRLAVVNIHKIEPDVSELDALEPYPLEPDPLEPDPLEPDPPEPDPPEPDSQEDNSQQSITLGVGQMEYREPEW